MLRPELLKQVGSKRDREANHGATTDRPATTAARHAGQVAHWSSANGIVAVPHSARGDFGRGPAARQAQQARYVGMGGFGQRVTAEQRLRNEQDFVDPQGFGAGVGVWRLQPTGFYGCEPNQFRRGEDGPIRNKVEQYVQAISQVSAAGCAGCCAQLLPLLL